MTFGGSPNPAQWSDVSEVVTDLANDLVRRADWDHTRFHSPHQPLLSSKEAVDNDEDEVKEDDAFGQSEFFAVDYPNDDDLPRFDCYLDDIFGAFMGIDEKEAAKCSAAFPLALHLVGRPHNPSVTESFPRDDILAIPKFLAEAKPSERENDIGMDGRYQAVHGDPPTQKSRNVDEVDRSDHRTTEIPSSSQGTGDDSGQAQPRSIRHPVLATFYRSTLQSLRSSEAEGSNAVDGLATRGLRTLEGVPATSCSRNIDKQAGVPLAH